MQMEVHVGHDDFLFLSKGGQDVFSFFTGQKNPKPESSDIFRDNFQDRAAYCQRTGRVFRTVIFPEKCVALKSKIALDLQFRSLYTQHYAGRFTESTKAGLPIYPINAVQDDVNAFLLTDTHYSGIGDLAMIQAILGDLFSENLEAGMRKIKAKISEKSNFSGDLGRKFTPPRMEVGHILAGQPTPFISFTNGIAANDGLCVLVSSPAAFSKGTLLIFGDSFFRQLLPMLAVFYHRIVFCRTRYFHFEMVEAFQPDHIFCGIAERYLSACFPDSNRPHFLSYPMLLGRAIAPDEGWSDLWKKFVIQRELIFTPVV